MKGEHMSKEQLTDGPRRPLWRGAVRHRVKLAILAAHRVRSGDYRPGDVAAQGAALVAVDCALDAALYMLDDDIDRADKHAVFSLQAARDAGVTQ